MRSRRSSHSVRASFGRTETDRSIMSRPGQIGSFTLMLSGISPSLPGVALSAGMSIAMPSSPSRVFSQP
jgi:hypothetical protein